MYLKGTHLQHLMNFISLSEKKSEIASPFYNNNTSLAFTYSPLKVKSQNFNNYPEKCLLPLLPAFHHPSPHTCEAHLMLV